MTLTTTSSSITLEGSRHLASMIRFNVLTGSLLPKTDFLCQISSSLQLDSSVRDSSPTNMEQTWQMVLLTTWLKSLTSQHLELRISLDSQLWETNLLTTTMVFSSHVTVSMENALATCLQNHTTSRIVLLSSRERLKICLLR